MKIKNLVYNIFLVLFVCKGIAQTGSVASADKKYDKYAYIDAIAAYEKVAEKGYREEKMFQRLGNAYYFNGELVKALKWYKALFGMNDQQEFEYYYRYAQTLKATGNYTKADKILELFNQKASTDKRGLLFEKNKNYLEQIKNNSGRFKIADAGINSKYSDYGSSFLDNKLVFASSRDTGGVAKVKFKWTNKSFTNLYSAELNADGSVGIPKRFERKINSKFNESTPVFTKDGLTMYFTRNNFLNGTKGTDDKKVTLLKLYKASYIEGKWTNIVELPFNSDQYSVAHPTLSIDEKKLYFASDMPGTFGQSDLYSVTINTDGSFSKPENLGAAINTEGRETFPFISGDNELYFASDGRPGLGGLDVFVSTIKKDLTFSEVQNVGAPINTKLDDFGFIIDSKSRTGFFSSNRDGGHGYDDVYRFSETRKLPCEEILSGTVIDAETNLVLENAKVNLLDNQLQIIGEAITGADGKYSFKVNCNKEYFVRAARQDYDTNELPKAIDKTSLTLPLKRTPQKVVEKKIENLVVGDDLAKILHIKMIYFDLGKSIVRKEAAIELEKIRQVMIQNPNMKIDVRSHTDSRQTHAYNEKLSDRRAKATVAWLVKKGIAADRITGKGYGETQLLNKCADGVKCTTEEHQANRRSEFIIVSM
ncbi:cell envelope biogenesis protein OmpA [Flavobacterium collinsii]|jgi:outer membrane protein OmpA-like peptidoglycan-associated protein/tetratricopeptide (TPR) repeat protein|uniref:OmpA family protein n=1 Tax=Flavobacterium collinsii TaxID=1114861 RepID=UPI0022C1C32F|nr:OmpA family protein [Flavobacterium collinsii]GIQ59827.1 cell envelope biogenesis protein OmpA [Flavobacterium collinsii]